MIGRFLGWVVLTVIARIREHQDQHDNVPVKALRSSSHGNDCIKKMKDDTSGHLKGAPTCPDSPTSVATTQQLVSPVIVGGPPELLLLCAADPPSFPLHRESQFPSLAADAVAAANSSGVLRVTTVKDSAGMVRLSLVIMAGELSSVASERGRRRRRGSPKRERRRSIPTSPCRRTCPPAQTYAEATHAGFTDLDDEGFTDYRTEGLRSARMDLRLRAVRDERRRCMPSRECGQRERRDGMRRKSDEILTMSNTAIEAIANLGIRHARENKRRWVRREAGKR